MGGEEMLKRLVAYVLGHLRISVAGGRIERFLNLAVAEGLFLWNIQRTPDRMRLSITIRDFLRLRPVARGAGVRVRILSRHGLPFRLARLKRRPVLILGAVACLVFLFWGAGHIWVVDVKITGPQALDPRAVKAVAADAGLKFGVWKGRVDVGAVQQHIQQHMGEVSVAVVRIQGTRAVVEVVEKAARNPTQASPCINLVARKSGVVEKIIPFMGEPNVRIGDTVKAGDLLVDCSLKYWPDGRPSVFPGTPVPPRTTIARTGVAQALVKARISYQQYREVPLVQEVPVPTGRAVTRWVLNWKEKTIILWGEKATPFLRYQERRESYSLGFWRNWGLPVELQKISVLEVEAHQERIPLETALSQAVGLMAARLRWSLGASDQLLGDIKAEIVEQGKDFAGIRVSAETLEEIAAPLPGLPPAPPLPPGQTQSTSVP